MFKPGDLVISTIHICDSDAPSLSPYSRKTIYTNICIEENEIGLVLENHLDYYTVLFGKKIIRVWNPDYDIKKYNG